MRRLGSVAFVRGCVGLALGVASTEGCAESKPPQAPEPATGAEAPQPSSPGSETSSESSAAAPVKPAVGPLDQLAVGGDDTCVRTADETIHCWGRLLEHEQSTTPLVEPVAVPSLADATEIELGEHHACIRKSDATVACWGYDQFGQVGDGTDESRDEPVPVKGLKGIADVGLGMPSRARVTMTAPRPAGARTCTDSSATAAPRTGAHRSRSRP